MKIFLIAGEESGDILGADLMASLQKNYPDQDFVFQGIGGARMEIQGMESLFPMQELSLMGIAEILPKVPALLKRINETIAAVKAFQPDIFLTIDSPDFCFRVAKGLKNENIEVPFKVHYVAPTVWAWRPKRAAKMAKLYDSVLCLFPFEPPYFEAEGMEAKFVGHPMSENLKDVTGEYFVRDHDLGNSEPVIGLLLGSRENEVKRMAPVFLDALDIMVRKFEKPSVIVPTLPHLQELVASYIKPYNFPCPVIVTSDPETKYEAMKACDMAMATSGTVGLELSVLGVPHVIAYKMSGLTYQIGKQLVSSKYIHLSNILLQEKVVPEFIQGEATAKNISDSLLNMIRDDTLKTFQLEAFSKVREKIKGADSLSPSDVCAEYLISHQK